MQSCPPDNLQMIGSDWDPSADIPDDGRSFFYHKWLVYIYIYPEHWLSLSCYLQQVHRVNAGDSVNAGDTVNARDTVNAGDNVNAGDTVNAGDNVFVQCVSVCVQRTGQSHQWTTLCRSFTSLSLHTLLPLSFPFSPISSHFLFPSLFCLSAAFWFNIVLYSCIWTL